MTPKITFEDSLIIDNPIHPSHIDAVQRLTDSEDTVLKVTIDATHSGLLTNGRVYPGSKVIKSYKSWVDTENGGTAEYNKPVLKHHDTYSDPIGRVIKAQYIKLKTGPEFKMDFKNPDKEGKGSGVVRITADITDIQSIQQIKDKRLLSVSAGFTTEEIRCSVCGDHLFPWLTSEKTECEHVPGKVYVIDDKKYLCYAITGLIDYKEISFVDVPAQPSAKLIQTDWESTKASNTDCIIKTNTRGKKSDFATLTLIDADGNELDLLKKSSKSLSTIIAVPPSCGVLDLWNSEEDSSDPDIVEPGKTDPLKNKEGSSRPTSPTVDDSGDNEKSTSESINDHKEESKSQSNDSNVNGELDNSSNKEKSNMTNKKAEISVDELKTSISALTEKVKNLEEKIKEDSGTISSLKGELESKSSEISRITGDMTALGEDTSTYLATAVANTRVLLRKPDTSELKTQEDFDSYVESLASRSVSSLKDSLVDLTLELQLIEPKEEETSNSIASDNKVEDPTKNVGSKSKIKNINDIL
jgi:hypothetical protein